MTHSRPCIRPSLRLVRRVWTGPRLPGDRKFQRWKFEPWPQPGLFCCEELHSPSGAAMCQAPGPLRYLTQAFWRLILGKCEVLVRLPMREAMTSGAIYVRR